MSRMFLCFWILPFGIPIFARSKGLTYVYTDAVEFGNWQLAIGNWLRLRQCLQWLVQCQQCLWWWWLASPIQDIIIKICSTISFSFCFDDIVTPTRWFWNNESSWYWYYHSYRLNCICSNSVQATTILLFAENYISCLTLALLLLVMFMVI